MSQRSEVRPCTRCGFQRKVKVTTYGAWHRPTWEHWEHECSACKAEKFALYHDQMADKHRMTAQRLRLKQQRQKDKKHVES